MFKDLTSSKKIFWDISWKKACIKLIRVSSQAIKCVTFRPNICRFTKHDFKACCPIFPAIKWPLYSSKSTKKSVKYSQAKSVETFTLPDMFISSKSCFQPWQFQHPPNCLWRNKLSWNKMLPMLMGKIPVNSYHKTLKKVQSSRQTLEQCSLNKGRSEKSFGLVMHWALQYC